MATGFRGEGRERREASVKGRDVLGTEAALKAPCRRVNGLRRRDTGVHPTRADLAKASRIRTALFSRILRFTLLAPDIVEAILDGRQAAGLRLVDLLEGVRLAWEIQRKRWRITGDQRAGFADDMASQNTKRQLAPKSFWPASSTCLESPAGIS